MAKQKGKKVRQPITEDNSKGGKQIRPSLTSQMKLESEIYELAYPDKKLLKENDLDGKIQWWLDRGAEPVPVQHERRAVYKGLNDKGDSDWVCWPGGNDDGTPFKVYLLMIDPELYDHYKLAPQRKRQEDIRAAMKLGKGDGSKDALTYAPNLPDGSGQGFNQIKSTPPAQA